ncbi:related to N-carbamoyl-D-amino acid hydrolase [Cephalotrichum gorgonifer]|uniref:Related to N-carbamoyl-D-amino acid hydrolase n=1 Tax=Cephalotrichum gorgonifer TaxID=2041049 RepID=A0AAE8MWW5_9PEZI|nr:related to N-carbamoyl-D-amino acid hydrolase [Cephalotrichum gorgonifer]
MPRTLKVAAAQLGANHLNTKRADVLARMTALLRSAAELGAQLVVFPETAFTTFFPRYRLDAVPGSDAYFDDGDTLLTSPNTRPLFDEAKTLGLDVYLGFAERSTGAGGSSSGDYNTCVYYSASRGEIIAKFRKIHLPGTLQPFEDPDAINQLEKLWFKPGDLGFEAFRVPGLVSSAKKENGKTEAGEDPLDARGDPIMGMMICNDRRWAESWRCYGLQGVEVVLCGYNTTAWAPDLCGIRKPQTYEESEIESLFQHRLVMTGNSYMNSCFSVSAGKAGVEDEKFSLIAGSMITSPDGYVLAEAKTKGDEIVFAEIDLDDCLPGKEMMFNFARHRMIHQYGRITSQTGVVEPPLLS